MSESIVMLEESNAKRMRVVAQSALAGSLVVLVGYLALTFLLRGPTTAVMSGLGSTIKCTENAWALEANISIDSTTGCPNAAEVNIEPREVRREHGVDLYFTSRVFPSGEYGGSIGNGAWALRSFILSGDAINANEWLVLSNSFVGSENSSLWLDAGKGLVNYPFDEYSTSWTGVIDDAVSGDRIPVVQTATPSSVAGYDISIARQDLDGLVEGDISVNPFGRFGYDISVSRDSAVKFQVLLLSVTTVVGAASAVLLTALVLSRRRPPSIVGLSWLATFLFALLEVRRNYPGDPPIGVRLDGLVTFPVVALLMSLKVVNGVLWLRREDWDLRNHKKIGVKT